MTRTEILTDGVMVYAALSALVTVGRQFARTDTGKEIARRWPAFAHLCDAIARFVCDVDPAIRALWRALTRQPFPVDAPALEAPAPAVVTTPSQPISPVEPSVVVAEPERVTTPPPEVPPG